MINCVLGPFSVVGECYLAAPNFKYAEKYPRQKYGKNVNLKYSVSLIINEPNTYREFIKKTQDEAQERGFSLKCPISYFEQPRVSPWGEVEFKRLEIWTFSSINQVPVFEGGEPTIDLNLDRKTQVQVFFDIQKKQNVKQKKIYLSFILRKVIVHSRPPRISIPPNVRLKNCKEKNGKETK